MGSSLTRTFCFIAARPLLRVLLALVLTGTVLTAGAPQATAAPATTTADIGKIRMTVDAGASLGATDLVERYGTAISETTDQFGTLFAAQPAVPIVLAFANAPEATRLSGLQPIAADAWASPAGGRVVVALTPFLALSPAEAENLLRNALGRAYAQTAAAGHLPPGMLDGVARYLEIPVLARQARLGSLVQGAYQAGTLPQWSALFAAQPPPAEPETAEAEAYAAVSFLIDRYGVGAFQRFVLELAHASDWPTAMRTAFAEPAATIEARWREDLPRWFEMGWQTSVVTAFDIEPAEALLTRGAYEAARASLQHSQQLFTELGDDERLARVEALIAQSDVGIQVEGLMGEAQGALTGHDYPRALMLLDQAEQLAVALPEAHRPAAQVAAYRTLADQGTAAGERLAEAERMAANWARTIPARELAVAAGTTFSTLGDGERADQARKLVHTLDVRQGRLLLTLGGFGLLVLVWLGFWLWARGPERFEWS